MWNGLRSLLTIVVLILTLGALFRARTEGNAQAAQSATPVLVELFTSEGCSSCPPADNFLQKLDQQPYAGLQVVVLSEHVDYWNHIGWKDPYSVHALSERQEAYGRSLHLDSVYTPQMIVDGAAEFVGSNASQAQQALERARQSSKVGLRISELRVDHGVIRGVAESDALPAGARRAEMVVALALDRAVSQVSRGENAGRRLTHVAVVQSLQSIGEVRPGTRSSHAFSLPIPATANPGNLRVVAFMQERGPGRVWAVSEEKLSTSSGERSVSREPSRVRASLQ